MRILFLAGIAWDYYQRLTPLCLGLARRGVDVVFVEPLVYRDARAPHLVPMTSVPVPEGVTLVRRKSRLRRGAVLAAWQNACNVREVLRWRPDVVVLSDAAFSVLPALCLLPSRTKVVLDYIDDWPEWSRVPWERWMLRHVLVPLVARAADLCTVTAYLLGEDLRPHARRVRRVPNGAPRSPAALSAADFLGGEGIAFVGALAERIDVSLLIDLARRFPRERVSVIGGGVCYPMVAEAARTLPNLYAPGPLPHDKAMQVARDAAVCLIPYRRSRLTDRCFPIKLTEYWSCGRAVVTTATAEVLRVARGRARIVSGPAGAADAVRELLESPEERARLGRAGFRAVERLYNYDVLTERFLRVIGGVG